MAKSKLELDYEKESKELVRLNKFIADAGICSRREADRLIEQGCVSVDGMTAGMGMKVHSWQAVLVKGKPVGKRQKMVLLAVNKPVGIICSTKDQKKQKNNIVDFLNYPVRIYSVGRLDKASEGLLLMTNHGEIVNKIMRAGNVHEKEYVVKVDKEITTDFLKQMRNGVPILDTVTRKCKVEQVGKYTFRIILTQGLNRQIRRMCEYLGYQVTRLKRERIMNITLGTLKPGDYRELTMEEMEQLSELMKDSSNTTIIKENNGDYE